jgi:hypothetical protein
VVSAQCSLADFLARANQRDDATIVVRIHLFVEQVNLRARKHRLNNGVHFGRIPAFAEIGDALDEGLHGENVAEERRLRVRN